MSPKKRHKRKPGPRPQRSRALGASPRGHEPEPDLQRDVRHAMQSADPFEMLVLASTLLAGLDQTTRPHWEPDDPERLTVPQFVDFLLQIREPEASGLLMVVAELVGDDVLARRIRRELAGRRHPLPAWLQKLAPLQVGRAVETVETLGDGENIMLDVRTAAGHAVTAVVFVDHNLGTLAKDGFAVPGPLDDVIVTFRRAAGDDPDLSINEIPLADARARIAQALERAAITYPPFETETWPAARPLVEWVTGHLPAGGRGYERPEWSDQQRQELQERFFASDFGRSLDDEDRELFDSLLWFACDYGPGDPLRWSPVAVEILLDDWLPRKVVADADLLSRAPDLLRAFIRFSHAERGVRPQLTRLTLDAVGELEEQYLRTIAGERLQGPLAMLAAMGIPVDGDDFDLRLMRRHLAEAVGGEDALAELDDDPLPDEPIDLSRVPEDLHPRVLEIASLADACCDELLDAEHRTAARRLLADVAAGDPAIFRRRSRNETAAAAIVWLVVKVNDAPGGLGRQLTAKELLAWFGLTGSVSQRAQTMVAALGGRRWSSYGSSLGTPRYLTAAQRRWIIDRRGAYGD